MHVKVYVSGFSPAADEPWVRRYLAKMKTNIFSKGQIVLPAQLRELDCIAPLMTMMRCLPRGLRIDNWIQMPGDYYVEYGGQFDSQRSATWMIGIMDFAISLDFTANESGEEIFGMGKAEARNSARKLTDPQRRAEENRTPCSLDVVLQASQASLQFARTTLHILAQKARKRGGHPHP